MVITAQSYETDARSWHEAHLDEVRAVSRADSYDRFASYLAPGSLVLDLGCGTGLDAPPLAARGLRLLGLDISVEMLRIARSLLPLVGRLLQGEMHALPLADGSVDAVVAVGSIHHLPKGEAGHAVREVVRVLRPGGVFAAAAERGSFEGFVAEQEGVAGRRWYAFYEPDEFERVFTTAGLAVIDRVVGGPSAHSAGFVALTGRKP